MNQLEGETAGLRQNLQTLQTELSVARSDNVQLYEKIRYLQSYQAKQTGAADSAYQIVHVDGDGIPQAKVSIVRLQRLLRPKDTISARLHLTLQPLQMLNKAVPGGVVHVVCTVTSR